jgi:hypothetical protein
LSYRWLGVARAKLGHEGEGAAEARCMARKSDKCKYFVVPDDAQPVFRFAKIDGNFADRIREILSRMAVATSASLDQPGFTEEWVPFVGTLDAVMTLLVGELERDYRENVRFTGEEWAGLFDYEVWDSTVIPGDVAINTRRYAADELGEVSYGCVARRIASDSYAVWLPD